jgi:hypothetical protein
MGPAPSNLVLRCLKINGSGSNYQLHERFEDFYQRNVTRADFRFAAAGVYNQWWRTEFWPPQHNFDVGPGNDTNKTWAAIGCLTDNDLKAP